MHKNRRQFIKLSGLAGGALLTMPLFSCENSGTTDQEGREEARRDQNNDKGENLDEFGIQLYTLKDEMAENPKEILKQLSSYGYKHIESFEGAAGMFWGMSNTEFKEYLDELDMKIISSHTNINENFEEKAKQAAEIGMKYLICPYVGPQETLEDYKRLAEQFNECGQICKDNGIRFAYHNHDYTFKEVEGVMPQDFLMENTDKDLVDFEMDIYWVVAAGKDPEEYLKKYEDRWKLCHIKDLKKTNGENNSTEIGNGSIDFSKILRTAKDNGMEYFIVEQEYFEGSTPLESSKKSAEYVKNLKI